MSIPDSQDEKEEEAEETFAGEGEGTQEDENERLRRVCRAFRGQTAVRHGSFQIGRAVPPPNCLMTKHRSSELFATQKTEIRNLEIKFLRNRQATFHELHLHWQSTYHLLVPDVIPTSKIYPIVGHRPIALPTRRPSMNNAWRGECSAIGQSKWRRVSGNATDRVLLIPSHGELV